eukprot:1588997-Rhodomonas_salina.2
MRREGDDEKSAVPNQMHDGALQLSLEDSRRGKWRPARVRGNVDGGAVQHGVRVWSKHSSPCLLASVPLSVPPRVSN